MKIEQRQKLSNEANLLQIINNTNRKYVVGRQEYLLLIKKQKEKEYCTLYITDCESTFWIKKIDTLVLEELKSSMSINTELSLFCKHFIQSLKNNSTIKLQHGEILIEVQLKIGTGLLMNCTFLIDTSISVDATPNDYKMILKMFLKQLFDAKEAQIEEQKKKWLQFQSDQVQKQAFGKKADPNYVKEVLHGNKKDASQIKPKNRSLMNPNVKKRKGKGIQFQGEIVS